MNSTAPSTNNMTPQPPPSNPHQQLPNQPQSQSQPKQDPYLTNDYYPLQLGNKAIIAALRADEVSSHADLYKVISASSSSTSTYHLVNEDGKSSESSAHNTNASGNGIANGVANRNGHHHHQINGTSNGTGTPNGINAMTPISHSDYQSPSSSLPHPILKYTNSIPIPQSMRQKIEQETKMSSLMGILPQGNMIWISVDDRLFLWEYGRELEAGTFESGGSGNGNGTAGAARTSGDFVCFRVPSGQCVVSVGLVKPKKGMYAMLYFFIL